MIIEPANDEDLDRLVDFYRKQLVEDVGSHEPLVELSCSENEGRTELQRMLGDDRGIVFVARAHMGELAIGFVAGEIGPSLSGRRDGQIATLSGLYVDPDLRDQEFGWSLVRAFSDWALANGCAEVHVTTYVGNSAAQNVYQSTGFNVHRVSRVEVLRSGTERYTVNDEEPWFGVRCHFQHPEGDGAGRRYYEERVTLWRADNMDHAIERAEIEAAEYADLLGSSYLNACEAYHGADSGFAVDGKEVFSSMRLSDLDPSSYLDRFFFTGAENARGANGTEAPT